MELTPEEKRKIYEEERTRIEAQKVIKKEEQDKKSKKYYIWLIVIVVIMVGGMIKSACNSETQKVMVASTDEANQKLKEWFANLDKDKSLYEYEYNTIKPNELNKYKYSILAFDANVRGLNKKQSMEKARKINNDIFSILHPAYPDLVIDVNLYFNSGKVFAGGYIWHPDVGLKPRSKIGEAFYK